MICSKRIHQDKTQIIDITDCITYLNFKNDMIEGILYTPLKQTNSSFDHLKSKRKTEVANIYFYNNLASE
jgi:hypothetical protein